jgi:hypothetical protein
MATPLSTASFAYDASRRTFSADASTIGLPAGAFPRTFDLRSARTGAVEVFSLAGLDSLGAALYRSRGKATRLPLYATIFNS